MERDVGFFPVAAERRSVAAGFGLGVVLPMPRGSTSTIRAGRPQQLVDRRFRRPAPCSQSTPTFTTVGPATARADDRRRARAPGTIEARLDLEDELADRSRGRHRPTTRAAPALILPVDQAEPFLDLGAERVSRLACVGRLARLRAAPARARRLRSNTDTSLKSLSTWPVWVHCSSASVAIGKSGSSTASSCFKQPAPHPAGGGDRAGGG